MSCMSVTHRDTTARWFQPARERWFMALAGITRRISVRSLGTAGPIPMVWAPGLPTATIPDGASALAMALATIPGITRGGVPWATTAAAGIRITDGVRGAGQP